MTVELKAFSSAIEKAIESKDWEPKEKDFLKQIKDVVVSVKDVAGIVQIVLTLAQANGISLEKLTSLFGKIFS